MSNQYLCSCCDQHTLDSVTLTFECDEGHIHEDTHFFCPACDLIDVYEVASRKCELF